MAVGTTRDVLGIWLRFALMLAVFNLPAAGYVAQLNIILQRRTDYGVPLCAWRNATVVQTVGALMSYTYGVAITTALGHLFGTTSYAMAIGWAVLMAQVPSALLVAGASAWGWFLLGWKAEVVEVD